MVASNNEIQLHIGASNFVREQVYKF